MLIGRSAIWRHRVDVLAAVQVMSGSETRS
jgi:hypothetical protein